MSIEKWYFINKLVKVELFPNKNNEFGSYSIIGDRLTSLNNFVWDDINGEINNPSFEDDVSEERDIIIK